ncbi:MAG: hypothetical protein Fur0044_41180 [Anaerolineae bacterium]
MKFPQSGANGKLDRDEAARLIVAFRARPRPSVLAKLDILLQLGQIDDPQIVPFLMAVVTDPAKPNEVRIDALKRLSDGPQFAPNRRPVAEAIMRVLREAVSLDLRLQATLALAELSDVDGVLTTLGGLALDPAETIDVRYAAFTSLEQSGPRPESIALLRQLTADETFSRAARSLLAWWKLG